MEVSKESSAIKMYAECGQLVEKRRNKFFASSGFENRDYLFALSV
jgi:hypothetical protein